MSDPEQAEVCDVFISYKRRLRPQVEALAELLRDLKLNVWFDLELEPGVGFAATVSKQLRSARAVLVCWTPDAFPSGGDKSGWVIGEANIARDRAIAGKGGYVPVLLEPVDPDPPFNTDHIERLVGLLERNEKGAWVVTDLTHLGLLHVVAALGKHAGRPGLDQYLRARASGDDEAVGRWKEQHPNDPLTNENAAAAAQAAIARAIERGLQRAPPWLRKLGPRRVAIGAVVLALCVFAGLILLLRPHAQETIARPAPPDRHAAIDDLSVFQDCAECPQMVALPTGSFRMGSPPDEEGRFPWEGPQRFVQVPRFAIGRTEVTFAEWDACAAAGGCGGYSPDDLGWGRADHPVLDISWEDAQAYARWLSEHTGQRYRLPTEAEWEYAARAGTETAYWWGDFANHGMANYGATACCAGYAAGRDQWVNTAPAASFPANAFGLHDMNGNLWEWVQDCYVNTYAGAPTDASAVEPEPCPDRVLRGGSWYNDKVWHRTAHRYWNRPTQRTLRDHYLGFRIARDFGPPPAGVDTPSPAVP